MHHVLVHGTFDADPSLDGPRWWQRGGAFHDALVRGGHGVNAFQWCGSNSIRARNRAAARLRRLLHKAAEVGEVSVTAHSHGGNVAHAAISGLPRRLQAHVRLTTVGTPFLEKHKPLLTRYDVSTAATMLAGLAIVVGALLGWGIIAQRMGDLALWGGVTVLTPLLLAGLGLFFGPPLLWVIRIVRDGAATWAGDVRPPVQVVVHPNDEVVSLFRRVLPMRLRPQSILATAAALNRAAKPASAIAALCAFAVAAWFVALNTDLDAEGLIAATAITLAGGAVSFVVVGPVVYGLLSAVGFLFAVPLAPAVNAIVTSALKAKMFGQDGEAKVRGVAETPHDAPYQRVFLGKTLDDAMAKNAARALGARVTHARGLVDNIATLDADALSVLVDSFDWRELIHTSYFQDDACRALILAAATRPMDAHEAGPTPLALPAPAAKTNPKAEDGAIAA